MGCSIPLGHAIWVTCLRGSIPVLWVVASPRWHDPKGGMLQPIGQGCYLSNIWPRGRGCYNPENRNATSQTCNPDIMTQKEVILQHRGQGCYYSTCNPDGMTQREGMLQPRGQGCYLSNMLPRWHDPEATTERSGMLPLKHVTQMAWPIGRDPTTQRTEMLPLKHVTQMAWLRGRGCCNPEDWDTTSQTCNPDGMTQREGMLQPRGQRCCLSNM